jgi:serine/threonine protein kinase
MQYKNFWASFVGEVIDDRYKLEKLIGSGSYGGVFQAKMVVLGHTLEKQVAVKLMQDGGEGGMQHCELKSALNLPPHDSLIPHFNWGQVDIRKSPMIYLVMELGEYCLDSYKRDRNVLNLDEVKEIVIALAKGLHYMHSKVHGGSEQNLPEQLIHRDLKPANVIKVGKHWKMADFGFTKSLNRGSVQATLICGTERYMPPEVFGSQRISTKWDVWSLGVMIVEMLAGHHPIKSPINSGTIQQEPIDLDGVPDKWIEIVSGCLQKDHKERWTAQQVLDAVETLDKSLSVEELYNQAFEHFRYEDHEVAISKYTEVIQLKSDYILAYAARGRVFKLMNDETNAKRDLEKAIALFPILTAKAYHARAIAKSGLNDKQDAIKDLTKAIELNPNYATAYRARGIILEEIGDIDKAISDFSKAIRIAPDDAEAYYNLGSVKSKKKDKEGAIDDYTKAILLKPNFAGAFMSRGSIRSELGEIQKAIEDYTEAIRIQPCYTNTYTYRGSCYQNLGEKPKALADFQEASRLYKLQGKIDEYNDAQTRIKKLGG